MKLILIIFYVTADEDRTKVNESALFILESPIHPLDNYIAESRILPRPGHGNEALKLVF